MNLETARRAELVACVAEQAATIVAQAGTMAALMVRIKELEDRLATDSHNSSKPPSTDRARRTRSLCRRSGKKPGGQPGHAGHTRVLGETADRVEAHHPTACAQCGANLTDTAGSVAERRQVVDLPPLHLEVVEHQAERVVCPTCGAATIAAFPAAVVQSVQYGPQLQALGVYLREYQLLPAERASELLADLFGAGPAVGTIETAVERCAAQLETTDAAIKDAVRASAVAHFDETGCAVAGQRHWLHVASTPTLTSYAHHVHRGTEASAAIGILPHFRGRAVHDAWSAYFAYPDCRHALCNAHHLRELTFVAERDGQAWAVQLGDLLREMNTRMATVRAAGGTALDAATRQDVGERYQRLVEDGLRANPPSEEPRRPGQRGRVKQSKARNLAERLGRHQQEVLAFLDDFAVPFENSLAERDLRMVKVQQKISGCFRSTDGADHFCRIRGYIATVRKQGEPVLSTLQRLFTGDPLLLKLKPQSLPRINSP